MSSKKTVFQNKFSKYLLAKTSEEKKEQLFKGEFRQSATPLQNPQSSSVFPFSNFTSSSKHSHMKTGYSPAGFGEGQGTGCKHETRSGDKMQEEAPVQRKRLKKLRQLEENQCGICLDQIKKLSHLNCKHQFCLECLKNWLANSNKCPYCRAEVLEYWVKGQKFHVEPRQIEFDQDEDFEEEEEETQFDCTCYNCQDTHLGDIMLICDRCEVNSCHVDCDLSLRGVMPEGDWYCHFCR